MYRRRMIHIFGIVITIIVISALVYALINYKFLSKEITDLVAVWGLSAMSLFCFLLEVFPTLIGLEPPVATAMLMGFNFYSILELVMLATIFANYASFLAGSVSSNFAKSFVEPENLKKYEKLWIKYGKATMVITAITPIPYIPAIAGIFKMNFWYFTTIVMGSRLLRHLVVFSILYYILMLI